MKTFSERVVEAARIILKGKVTTYGVLLLVHAERGRWRRRVLRRFWARHMMRE